MANCESCISANKINRCASSIYIPDVSGTPDGDYNVIIENTATGRIENVPVTADAGTLTVPIEFELMTGHVYKVQVFENGDYNEPREITIGVESACCVEFSTIDYEIGGETAEILSKDTCE